MSAFLTIGFGACLVIRQVRAIVAAAADEAERHHNRMTRPPAIATRRTISRRVRASESADLEGADLRPLLTLV